MISILIPIASREFDSLPTAGCTMYIPDRLLLVDGGCQVSITKSSSLVLSQL